MTPSELDAIRKRYPVGAGVAALNSTNDSASGRSPIVQKQQIDLSEQANRKAVHRDESRAKGVDGTSHPRYRITIALNFSDDRQRDADGSLATIMDCLVHAAERLMEMGARNPRQLPND